MMYKPIFFLYLFLILTSFVIVPQKNEYKLSAKEELTNKKNFYLFFHPTKTINISGTIKNLYLQPIGAEIILVDEKNTVVASTKADNKTGYYSITANIIERAMYTLVYYNAAYFPEYAYINSKLPQLGEKNIINKTMVKLNVGENYTLLHHEFISQGLFSYNETAPLYSLAMLMQKNPTMKIQATVYTDPSELVWVEKGDWSKNVKDPFPVWRANNFMKAITRIGIPISRVKVVPSYKEQINMPKGAEKCEQGGRVDITILSK